MEKYIVCYPQFRDAEDKHVYSINEDYPHKDRDINTISKKRIESLMSTNNKIGKQLIRVKELEEYTLEELQEYCSSNEIEIDDKTSKDEILEIINKFVEEH
ncbi:MAG: hypothetical protein K2G03_03510, partial [Bacilli bacterium]|nr:hypothetical protein [Bacilli bacterium]